MMTRFGLAARMAAPWIAVFVFLVGLHNGWAALLAYHAQIVAWAVWDRWARRRVTARLHLKIAEVDNEDELLVTPGFALWELLTPPNTWLWWLTLVPALTGPVLYFAMPRITSIDLGLWLADFGLSGISLALLIPYFGLVHPWLEQRHWLHPRERTPVAHLAFAGYHGVVLWTLLPILWVAFIVGVLALVSVGWAWLARQIDGRAVAAVSHVTADLSVILAVTAAVGV
ncbi:MAG: hypothetical protein MUP36_00160 [Demequinaceae bacterium]|nr:hypothetical protein [Demequinaceae bacterium]